MISSIQVRDFEDTFMGRLPVADQSFESPYIVKNIDGVGPVKADISVSEYAMMDGGTYQNAKVSSRNIVLTIGYRPNYASGESVEDVRWALYNWFQTKRFVRLVFMGAYAVPLQIDGYVESHEPSIFSNKPEVQISIICPDPHFVQRESVTLNGVTGSPLNVVGQGTAQTGFLFDITLTRALYGVTLENDIGVSLGYSRGTQAGDRLRISTAKGAKHVYHVRGTTWSQDLNNIESGTLGVYLGGSVKSILAGVSGDYALPYTLTFTPKFIGL